MDANDGNRDVTDKRTTGQEDNTKSGKEISEEETRRKETRHQSAGASLLDNKPPRL